MSSYARDIIFVLVSTGLPGRFEIIRVSRTQDCTIGFHDTYVDLHLDLLLGEASTAGPDLSDNDVAQTGTPMLTSSTTYDCDM